jgi:COX assembly protein 2
MHPPLFRPHPQCGEIVEKFVACHKENPLGKWFGNCNELKRELDECFYLEKKAKQGENLRKAREFDAKFEEMLKKGSEKQDS